MNICNDATPWFTTIWWPFDWYTLPWACPTHAGLPPTATTATGDLQAATHAPAGLGLSRHHHGLSTQSQASAPSPPPQGQFVMGSPDYGTLWPVLQQRAGTTQASRGQGSPLHLHMRCHSAFLQRMLALHMHPASQQQDRPLPSGLPHDHQLHWHSSVWSLQSLVHLTATSTGQTSPDAPFLQIDSRALD